MGITEIIALVTFVVTFICGILVKKIPQISNKLIPIQNLAIGVIVAIIEWIITKDFSTAIALSGVMAGGVYDIQHNLKKLFNHAEK
jgi:di/tricarboxylate transporter